MNVLTFAVAAWAAAWLPAAVAASACDLLSPAEAGRLLGAPIAAPKPVPTRAAGGGLISACRYLPAGYDLDASIEPPTHGLEVTLHTLQTAELARARLRWSRAQAVEIQTAIGGGDAGGRVADVGDLGDAAFVVDRDRLGMARLNVLRGRSMVEVQAWNAAGSSTGVGTSAARQIAARLR